ncbi:hypothetical protein G7051_11575 [Dysgonomonas sp. HDW5B]|uniref:hypothetical protein n=1 Tax=Dysgonomonas sp. HDW5B TaxID=2714927 RepID=UPI00140CC7F5|nr:hypothetical protein [Dysgonomonas sp. HDW5B]QIK54942.1 hypothetical protein G7051_11575 [Dysgonomonas sp. HDW5B]
MPDPIRTRKLKQKKTFTIDILLFLNAFIRPAGTPCNRQGRKPDGRKTISCVSPSASVAQPLADKRNGRKTKRAVRQ